MFNWRHYLMVLLAGLLLLAPGTGWAQVSQQMEIILDASGSMWGKVNNEAKITVAKRVLIDLVEQLKDREDLELAIRVYGHQSHRSKHDCEDTKLELPFGKPNPEQVRALTKRIKAQGYTPIAYSLLQAKDDFKAPDMKRILVLITDGLESCEGDPCQLANQLAAKGLDVKLHVVGFDLKKSQLEKLQCLVQPSGGLLLGAGDAQQLEEALGEVVQQALARNLLVKTNDGDGQPVYARVQVISPKDGKVVSRRNGKQTGFKLPAGEYDILAAGPNGAEKRASQIKLTETELTEVTLKFDLARLLVSGTDSSGDPAPLGIKVQRKNEAGKFEPVSLRYSGDEPARFDLPPGQYRVEATHRNTRETISNEPFSLANGETKEIKLNFGKAKITVSGKTPQGQPIAMRVFLQNKRPTGGYQNVIAKDATEKPAVFEAPPGEYRLYIKTRKTNDERTTEPFTLQDGGQEVFDLVFGKAKITVSGKTPQGQPIAMRVFLQSKRPTGGFQNVTAKDATEKPAVFEAPPGEYRLYIKTRKTNDERTTEPFTLQDGGQKVFDLVFGKAKITVSGKTPQGQPIEMRVFLQKKRPTGGFQNVTARNATEKPAVFEAPPDEYRLYIKTRKTNEERITEPFVLQDGGQKELSFTFGVAQLSVIGVDPDGKPLEIQVVVQRKTPAGGFKHIKHANGGSKPAFFDLPSGEYRLLVTNRKTKEKRTVADILLKDGDSITKRLVFE